jgi:hypothetical protein
MKTTSAGNRMHIPEERMRRPTETETAIRAQKEELRKRIEHDPQLKKDFDFPDRQDRLAAETATDRSLVGLQHDERRSAKADMKRLFQSSESVP